MKYPATIVDISGNQLETLQEIPDKGNKFPTIVMISGLGMDLHEFGFFDEISNYLVKNGFATIRFSFSGTGNSGGDYSLTTLTSQIKQVEAVLEYALADRFTDIENVGVYAHDFGVASALVAGKDWNVKAFCFTGIAGDILLQYSRYFRRQHNFKPTEFSQLELPNKKKIRIAPTFWNDLKYHNFIGEAKKITQPIQFIHGSFDHKSKLWEVKELFEALEAPKRIHIIQKADHVFSDNFRSTFLKLLTEWFSERLVSQ